MIEKTTKRTNSSIAASLRLPARANTSRSTGHSTLQVDERGTGWSMTQDRDSGTGADAAYRMAQRKLMITASHRVQATGVRCYRRLRAAIGTRNTCPGSV